jgi:hypothetical protein
MSEVNRRGAPVLAGLDVQGAGTERTSGLWDRQPAGDGCQESVRPAVIPPALAFDDAMVNG